jgi:type IX secretion system PorP/SprF family membrane protein
MKGKGAIIVLLFFVKTMFCQDLHFSQFNRVPLFLNPALTGSFDGDYRIMSVCRNQWQTIPVPYNSMGISADMTIPFPMIKDYLGAGLQVTTDRAGDSKYTTLQASASGAYHLVSSNRNVMVLSIGGAINYIQRSYDPGQLNFDNQFNGDYFDPRIPITEQFDRLTLRFVDVGIGVNYNQTFNEKNILNIGTSVQHINTSNHDFLATASNSLLQRKFNIYASADVNIYKSFSLVPIFYSQWQGVRNEIMSGIGGRIKVKPYSENPMKLGLGLNYRWNDAMLIWAQFEQNRFSVQLSYDMNNSPLSIATNSYGGLELTLGYIFKFKNIPRAYDFCPYIWF